MAALDASLVLDLRAGLLEGPVWDPNGALYFVDIMRGRVHRYDPATRAHRTIDLAADAVTVGAVALSEKNDLVLAARDGFARVNPRTGAVSKIADVEADRPNQRMNDGKVDPAGRFWAGTMALDETARAGSLYRLDRDGSVRAMLRDVTISNGLDWSPDRETMYYIDSPTRRIDMFDFDAATGAIGNRRTFVPIARQHGIPDGLTVDVDGCVWVALWRGAAVHRYTPYGILDTVVNVPTSCPTSCAFGGADLRDLFITTAAMELNERERAEEPLAGGLFVCRPGAAGRAPNRFKG
ncbi:MAG TPA: SMP-30/gluconolactonase/LRE family protein [Vicinamibacterales bacterium]|nr:SMP-30/gluconolactonase/LRE family protein [Vicinamibacterales bacterium]